MKDKDDLVAELEAVKDQLHDLRWLIDENDLHSSCALMLRIKADEMRSLLNDLIRQLISGKTKAYKERAKHPLPAEVRDAYISDLKARFGNQRHGRACPNGENSDDTRHSHNRERGISSGARPPTSK